MSWMVVTIYSGTSRSLCKNQISMVINNNTIKYLINYIFIVIAKRLSVNINFEQGLLKMVV